MEIEHCLFPDELLYDPENNTWLRPNVDREVIVGIASVLSAIAGRFTQVKLRKPGTTIQKGHSLGTLETPKFVGPMPSPITGKVQAINGLVVANPKVLNDSPYEEGWIARIEPSNFQTERDLLLDVWKAEHILRDKITQFRARCFKAFPDHEMVEIGVECSAVLVKLNELVSIIPSGDVVHIVSDDPTAYVEMVRWTDQTGNPLVEWRTEGGYFHFIVKKAL